MPSANQSPKCAIVTVAMGRATEALDYSFLSFAHHNPGVALHAFILGEALPKRQFAPIHYHLVAPTPDFSHPLREVYFRRHALIDTLGVDYALVVDCLDVLSLRRLPDFAAIVGAFSVAACTEHAGSRYILGQGYTSNFLNGGVTFWNVARSREIRREIVERGRAHFRTVADDQYVINEVVQTKYFDQLRILPCQFNFRAHLEVRQRGWPTVKHLDGVLIYHNATCMDAAKKLVAVKVTADLPPLPVDGRPLTPREQFWRRVGTRLSRHIAR